MSLPMAGGPGCEDPAGACVTCSDQAVPARIVELREHELALVSMLGEDREVSVALVEVRAGDTVLVHADEAIAVVEGQPR